MATLNPANPNNQLYDKEEEEEEEALRSLASMNLNEHHSGSGSSSTAHSTTNWGNYETNNNNDNNFYSPNIWARNNPPAAPTLDYDSWNSHEGLYSSWDMSCGASHNGYGYTSPRNTVVEAAKTMEGSMVLQRFLDEGNHVLRQQIFKGILGNLFEVMTNEFAHHLFRKLLEDCESREVQTIVFTLCSHDHLFVEISLQKYGSTAIQNLIKKLRRLGFGKTITHILSQRFLELMTSAQGQYVVQQCLKTFKPNENRVLYDALVYYLIELATCRYGCISLNICLDCMSRTHQTKLLEQIVEHSEFLSHDPWGHYVVQHVLTLKEENISRAICIRLERHYMHLAQRIGGSHVVENCMKSSEFGMESVVRTLLRREKALLHLASDKFGNYVVQKALEVTKQDNRKLYESLVMVIMTKKSALSGNVIGRHVVNMIKRLEDNNV
ncbi:hypothetical protein DM860_007539 [Cuscuta australis]|uniref:PUM-HD domain-containing protein n=1 Tax=Cuscuta australis TaxID=267555 RepID=A0A328E8G3_9ASTE|nr:hypothetical protein DM860_007539 [Cuscuta australis]